MAAAPPDVGAAMAGFVNETKAEIRNLKQVNVALAKRVEALETAGIPAQKVLERQDSALTQLHSRCNEQNMRIDTLAAQQEELRDESSGVKRGVDDLTKQQIDRTTLVNDLERSRQQRTEQERLLTELGAYVADSRNEQKRLRTEIDRVKAQHQEFVAKTQQMKVMHPQSTKPQFTGLPISQLLQQPEPLLSRSNSSNVNTANMPPPRKISSLTSHKQKLPVGGVNDSGDPEPEPKGSSTAQSSFEREASVASSVTFCTSSPFHQRKTRKLEQLTHSDPDSAGHEFSSAPEEGDVGSGDSQSIIEAESEDEGAHISPSCDFEPMEVAKGDEADMSTSVKIGGSDRSYKRRRISSTEPTGAYKGDDLHLPTFATLQSPVKNRSQQVAGRGKAVVPSTQKRSAALKVPVCHLDLNIADEEEEEDDDDTIFVRPRKKQASPVSVLNSAVSVPKALSSYVRVADHMPNSLEIKTPSQWQADQLQAASATDAKSSSPSQTATTAPSPAKNGTSSSTTTSSSGSDKTLTAQTTDKAKGAAKAVTSSDLLKQFHARTGDEQKSGSPPETSEDAKETIAFARSTGRARREPTRPHGEVNWWKEKKSHRAK
ncbi:hypothetical protein LTR37_016038 [Vermiconidia calcicola]|uniref:Uncharacterized protein n=1 Tax=Vermiconidia calcicola TaxID=1690605 RepID=A0ACC3MPA8_9PEZI|nr:hypothetical protein LTR37_016038 [Vermiconidia calcicola]